MSDHFLGSEGLSASPEETWELMRGARGLWAMYHNAGVMLEMAYYAARNSISSDLELLASLRSDAIQIRVGALTALLFYSPFAQTRKGHIGYPQVVMTELP